MKSQQQQHIVNNNYILKKGKFYKEKLLLKK